MGSVWFGFRNVITWVQFRFGSVAHPLSDLEAIVGQRCYDGDQGVMPATMEIMMVLWRWRSKAQDDDGHMMSHILIACDVYLLCILFG